MGEGQRHKTTEAVGRAKNCNWSSGRNTTWEAARAADIPKLLQSQAISRLAHSLVVLGSGNAVATRTWQLVHTCAPDLSCFRVTRGARAHLPSPQLLPLRVPGNQTFPGMSKARGHPFLEKAGLSPKHRHCWDLMVGTAPTAQHWPGFPQSPSPAHILVHGLRDELALAVDAGVGSLAGDLLLLLGNAARRWRAPASVQRACDTDRHGSGREPTHPNPPRNAAPVSTELLEMLLGLSS